MPIASIFYVSPAGNALPTSPLAGDIWNVTPFADAAAAEAALDRRPDAVLYDAADATGMAFDRLCVACQRTATPMFPLAGSGTIAQAALAFERARIDRQLNQLRDLGGDDFVAEMIDLFLAQAQNQLATMRDSLSRGESTEVQKLAHTLKSSAGNFGARALQELCARTERAATTDTDRLPELLGHIETAYWRLRSHLETRK